MDTFNYLAVLFSIILGLALTQILASVRALILARSRVKLYWPALIWAGTVFLIVTQDWWAMSGMRGYREWTFAMYAIVLLQVILLYLVAGLALPDIDGHAAVDLRESYFKHARWFFGLFSIAVVVSPLKDLVLSGHLPSAPNAAFHIVFLVTAAIAALTRSRWYHALLAPVMAVIFVAYIALLFARL